MNHLLTRTIILGMLVSVGAISCEKDVAIALHNTKQEVVVDASIENGKPPHVVLTHSLNYFSKIDETILKDLFIHQAHVTVSDQKQSVTLTEHSTDTLNGNKFYYYTSDPRLGFIGKKGETYTLLIETNGKKYEAQTTIPKESFQLDSIWWIPGKKDDKPDSAKAFLMVRIIDPPQRGNYARYFTKRNEEPFYPGLSSVADDQVTNGTTFNFQIDRGVNKNMEIDFDDYGYFDPGDTVIFKFCNIDQATFNFWHTWEYAWSNSSNPFSTPTTVLGNIPGALGYWGGYAVQYKAIIIPH